MNKRIVIISSIIFIVILGIFIGLLIYRLNASVLISNDKNVINGMDINIIDNHIVNDDVITTNNQEEKSSPNAKMTFETYYRGCSHSIIAKEIVSENEVNKNEEYFKDTYSDWVVKDFKHDNITLYKEVEGNCGKHYLIKEEEGVIVVYTINADGSQTFKESTNISTQYLPEADIAILKVGIKADGDAELSQKLEDFE